MAERADSGFTLVEVTVVTLLLGLISLVIGFAITTVLRVTPGVDSQVSDARSLQGLTAWFHSDAASAVASGTNVRTNPSSLSCSGSETEPGVNLVEFEWTVAEPASTTYIAAYRLEPDGPDQTVRRYECSGSAAPFSGTEAQNLTGPLANSANVTANAPAYDRVTLELQAVDGTPLRVEATPRSPAAALPATTVPATLPPPTPPTPCTIDFDVDFYGPVSRVTSGSLIDKLAAGVTLEMDVLGDTCGVIEIEYDTGVQVMTRPVTWSGSRGLVSIPKGDDTADTAVWLADNHPIEVYNNCSDPSCTDPPLDTTVLEVT